MVMRIIILENVMMPKSEDFLFFGPHKTAR